MFPGLWFLPKRTPAGGLLAIKAAAVGVSPGTRLVLDIGKGTFDLPPQSGETEDITLLTLDHFTLRGAGPTLTILQAPGGEGTWALRVANASWVTLRDFAIAFAACADERSAGIDLEHVDHARVERVHVDPLRFWGLRAYGGDASALPPAPRIWRSSTVASPTWPRIPAKIPPRR